MVDVGVRGAEQLEHPQRTVRREGQDGDPVQALDRPLPATTGHHREHLHTAARELAADHARGAAEAAMLAQAKISVEIRQIRIADTPGPVHATKRMVGASREPRP